MNSSTISNNDISLFENDLLNCFRTLCVPLLYFIQLGFIFIEIGFINKLQNSILIKNILDIIIPSLVWIFVYSFSTNSNTYHGFIGHFNFNFEYNLKYLLQLGYMITSQTIVSGALSERISILFYIFYTTFTSLFIFPFIFHSISSNHGFLYELNFKDYSGASSVHMTGGLNSLILLIYFGHRKGRLDKRRYFEFEYMKTFYIVAGLFFMWLGWFGFNLSNVKNRSEVIPVVFNTIIIPIYTAIFYTIIDFTIIRYKNIKIIKSDKIIKNLVSVFISGLVGSTSFSNDISYNNLYLLSIILAISYKINNYLFNKYKLDDPVNAVICHFTPGIVTIVFTGLFNKDQGLLYSYNWKFFGIQCIGILLIIVWVLLVNIIFFCFYKLNLLYLNLDAKFFDQFILKYEYEDTYTDLIKKLKISGVLVWELTQNHRGYKLNPKKSSCFYLSFLNYFKSSNKFIFPINEGLIGWVAKHKIHYLYNIDINTNDFTFDRYYIAKECKIRNILLIPICVINNDNEFICKYIIEFLCRSDKIESIYTYDLWKYIINDKKIILENDELTDIDIELDDIELNSENISNILIDTDYSNYNQFILDNNFKILSLDSINISKANKDEIIYKNFRFICPEINIEEIEQILEPTFVIKKYDSLSCVINDNYKIKINDISILSNRKSTGEVYYLVYFKILS